MLASLLNLGFAGDNNMGHSPPATQPYPKVWTVQATSPRLDGNYANTIRPSAGGSALHDATFEGGTLGQQAQGANSFSDAFSGALYSDQNVRSGTRSAEISITSGATGFGQWGGLFLYPAIPNGGEIWYRAYHYFPPGFSFVTDTTYLKTQRVHVATSGGANGGYHDLLIGGNGANLTAGSEVAGPIYYQNNPGWRTVGSAVPTGTWHALEIYVKFSNIPGQGIYRIWQDGILIFEDLITQTLGNASDVSDFCYLFSYWNGGAPQTQSSWADDIIITSATPPATDAAGNFFIGT